MNSNRTEITVEIERLDAVVEEHLRTSTAVLHDMLRDSDGGADGHMCQYCGKIYKTTSTLHTHSQLLHPQNEQQVRCVTCNKSYRSVLSLQKHEHYMHLYNRCNVCYKTFTIPDLFEVHVQGCIKKETPCSQCGKIFDSLPSMRNHMRYKHPEKKDHWCEICRRGFTSDRRLLNHKATLHPMGATDCTQCGKSFESVRALQSHTLYRHTDDGAKCVQCRKVFANVTRLQKHLAKNHL